MHQSQLSSAPPSNVASPAPSNLSSTNPFFKKSGGDAVPMSTAPTSAASPTPTPSAFDALFGPSSHFAPTGQSGSRAATPPATSFVGRSIPNAGTAGVAAGGGTTAASDSGSSSDDDSTPPSSEHLKDVTSASRPPPPPESRQFTPSDLPIRPRSCGRRCCKLDQGRTPWKPWWL